MSLETKDRIAALHCELVSAERSIFSGVVKFLSITGDRGELGVFAGHSPLLTAIAPGHLKLIDKFDEEQHFFVEGGYLEIQPHSVTVLADTVLRAAELDLQQAIASKAHAEKAIIKAHTALNFSQASHELLEAMAKIQIIESYRNFKARK